MAASNQVITDLGTVETNGLSATTNANAIAPAGPIQDAFGNIKLAKLHLQEAKNILTSVQLVMDTGTDGTNKTLIANVLLSLV